MIEPASNKVLDIPPEVAYKGGNEHMPTSAKSKWVQMLRIVRGLERIILEEIKTVK